MKKQLFRSCTGVTKTYGDWEIEATRFYTVIVDPTQQYVKMPKDWWQRWQRTLDLTLVGEDYEQKTK